MEVNQVGALSVVDDGWIKLTIRRDRFFDGTIAAPHHFIRLAAISSSNRNVNDAETVL